MPRFWRGILGFKNSAENQESFGKNFAEEAKEMAVEASDTDNDNLQFELLLIETGRRLMHPSSSSTDHLISLLDEVEICLSKVDQKPSKSMQNALSNLMKALVAKHLFCHSDEDVKVSVASCICELTRITAPDTPYDDDQMKEVFKLIVSSLKNLSLKSSRSYSRRISILRNVATLRLCLVMLDLDCDALIIEMFQHFVNAMRDYHPKNVFSYMEMIMIHVLKESENISMELLFPILLVVKRENKEVLPIARNLVGRVLASSASKLKTYLIQAVKDLGLSLCHYSEIVASICQGNSGALEQNDAAINDHKDDKAIPKESGSTKQVDLANDKSPKLVVSDPVMQSREDETLADSNSLKKCERDHLAEKPINIDLSSIAEADYLGTEKVVNSEFESDAKNRLTKSNSESAEPSENLCIHEEEVETVPGHEKDSKDLPGSSHEDLSVDGTVSLQSQKGTCIQPSNLESIKPSENCYICIKDVEALPEHKMDGKDALGASYEDLPIDLAVSLRNGKEAGIRPLKFTEPSENCYTYETLLDCKKDSKGAPNSLHNNLSIRNNVSFQNDKETAIRSPSPEEKEDEVTNLTFSIPSGTVPDAQPRREDSMIKATTPVVDNAFRKASKGTSDSEPRQNKCSGEQVAATVSKEDKTSADIDESKKENGTATTLKATSQKQLLKNLGATSNNGDGLSSKHLELKKESAQVKSISGKDGTKSSAGDDSKASVSIKDGENPVGLKVNIYWPKGQIGQISASPDKVQSAEPSDLHTSIIKGTVNSNLVIHINGQPKKRKSVASRASDHRKRLCYNAVEKTHNTVDEMSSAFKFKATQRESSNETTLYQKCLEELQELEGLDDAEFAKAVNFLKDDRNAIAFATIKGPRRLVWLRSLWQHCQHCNPKR